MTEILGSSFRDPSGFIFFQESCLYRQINKTYSRNYQTLMESGLYEDLLEKRLLIPHKEVSISHAADKRSAYKVIKPEMVPFISYPYEWSFSMLKDAALTTLKIQEIALKHKMVLKDASAYNIQFVNARPVFIDTLSFESYEEGAPWIAYQQFCKHFLAPLALMSYLSVEFGKLSQIYLDGVSLDFASRILSYKTRLNPGLLIHIHLHAQSQTKHENDAIKNTRNIATSKKVGSTAMLGILDSLQTTTKKLEWKLPKTEWGNYYATTNYSNDAMERKNKQVEEMILATSPKIVWDFGANTGRFSKLASRNNILTVAFDIDPVAVEIAYLECKRNKEQKFLPIIQNLTNPSANIGFANNERNSLLARGPADTTLALALIHHLAISNNLPFNLIARFFAKCGRHLIIEFVPKSDSQVQRLLVSRKDIFDHYTQDVFKSEFSKYFTIKRETAITGSERKLYLMERKNL